MNEPFLKWAGGKRWLANSNQLPIPASYNRYIEPFLGGGAIFFRLAPKRALISDVNAELIHLYNILRDNPIELMELLKEHHARHCSDYYYLMRSKIPEGSIEKAARTMYLNRTCWNGLYRVNLKGKFNVPIGTKKSVVYDNDNFEKISRQLQSAEILCCDFETSINQSTGGDFIFIDPPYTVCHNLNGFIKYNENIFSWNDQIRLRNAVSSAIDRGAAIVITNADHDSVRELYKDICEYKSVSRASILSGDATRRGQTTEALFSANI